MTYPTGRSRATAFHAPSSGAAGREAGPVIDGRSARMRRVVGALLGAALFAGSAAMPVSAATIKRIYAFASPSADGANPAGSLTPFAGKLYGATGAGGSAGQGAVFSVTLNGLEKLVYSFQGGNDGALPMSSLTAFKGVLYGTTYEGGVNNAGVVFAVTPDGREQIVHSFGSVAKDGKLPMGGLTVFQGRLYGTTFGGGDSACNGGSGCGTVFSVGADGSYAVVARFSGRNGAVPYGSNLLVVGSKLYGTTQIGGDDGQGNVFSLTADGKIETVYDFKGGDDGAQPGAGLTELDGKLYGTTENGGSSGLGTVFSLTLGGKEAVLHSFAGGNDGSQPQASLTAINKVLYGTTSGGGRNGSGTVFSVSTAGHVSITPLTLAQGAAPDAGLIPVNGVLFGTAFSGGDRDESCGMFGCGTVFSVTP